MERCSNEHQCQFITEEILESARVLCKDQYGNYVIQVCHKYPQFPNQSLLKTNVDYFGSMYWRKGHLKNVRES